MNGQAPHSLPPQVFELCSRLREAAPELDSDGQWPSRQLAWCAAAGVYRWFVPGQFGGLGWNEQQILAGYLELSQACMTTTFVLTQWHAACRRIVASQNEELKQALLPRLASGECFATVGISHLTTSRQHLGKPVLTALAQPDGSLILNGFSPWVTGAAAADVLVLGASLPDDTQVLCAVPATTPGVRAHPGAKLVALSASCTDQVELEQVRVAAHEIIAGPIANVMQANSGGGAAKCGTALRAVKTQNVTQTNSSGGAGGLQTSTLAIGLSMAAAKFITEQAKHRPDLTPVAEKISSDCQQLGAVLARLTSDIEEQLSASELRQRANSLVLRSTQAALSAAKGAGFVASHPTGRWAREALFFLVWSCPQAVVNAHLCELAQLD